MATPKTSKFTHAEWQVILPNSEHPSRAMVCAGSCDIYDAPLTTETAANAHLIAAAPEMYAVLKAMELEARKMLEQTGEFPVGVIERAREIVSAVEKAEGGL